MQLIKSALNICIFLALIPPIIQIHQYKLWICCCQLFSWDWCKFLSKAAHVQHIYQTLSNSLALCNFAYHRLWSLRVTKVVFFLCTLVNQPSKPRTICSRCGALFYRRETRTSWQQSNLFRSSFMKVHIVMVWNVFISLVVVGSFTKAHMQCFLARFEFL